jgi:hypothetical protein
LDLLALDKDAMPKEANRTIKQVLVEQQVPALDEAILREGNEILKAYKKRSQ